MKKISLYLITLLTVVAFTACGDDYDDWAAPQTNDQEDSKEISFQVSAIADAIDLNTLTADSIEIAKIDHITVEEGGSVKYEIYFGSDAIFAESEQIPYVIKDNKVKVKTNELEDIMWDFYGKQGQANNPQLRIYAIVITANGQATRVKAADIPLTITTKTLPLEENYYMVGSVNGWQQTGLPQFTKIEDGIFELVVNITDDKSYFKIIPQSGLDNLDVFWDLALGVAKDGDDSKTGTLVYKREGDDDPGAMVINGPAEVKIKLNMKNYTYKIGPKFDMPENMYVTGSPWSWGLPSGGNRKMVPVNGVNGFWTIYYLDVDSEIKFFPQTENWNNGIGYSEVTIPTASVDLGGLTNSGGNIKNATAGWYLLLLTADEDGEYTIQYIEPKIWLIGEASNGGWSDIATNPADLFTAPADATGEFISPTFTNDGALRMAVVIPGIDWWRTEFNLYSGVIEYRGNSGDQSAVTVTAGMKAYLDLIDQTGEIR